MRICISGIINGGKTLITPMFAHYPNLVHTDNMPKDKPFDVRVAELADAMHASDEWIYAGIPTIRAIETLLQRYPATPPCDYLFWLGRALSPNDKKQQRISEDIASVFDRIEPALTSLRVPILALYNRRRRWSL